MQMPIMQRALGEGWERLGAAVRRHYAVVPGTDDEVVMAGEMDVRHALVARPFLWFGRLIGALIDRQGSDVPVTVRNWCRCDSPAMHWHRSFRFGDGSPLVFASRMEYVAGDEIVEYVRFGLGVRMRLSEEGGALVYRSCGYRWDLGPVRLHLPDWLFLGRAEIREEPVGEDGFRVLFTMRHPLFGETFGYRGAFRLLPAAVLPGGGL